MAASELPTSSCCHPGEASYWRGKGVTAPNHKGQGLQQLVWWPYEALASPGCTKDSEMLKIQVWRGAVLPISHPRQPSRGSFS